MTGQEIKQLRLAIGVSQGVFANYLGVEHSTISRWERNLHPVGFKAALRLLYQAKDAFAADPEGFREYLHRGNFAYPP